MYDTTPGHARRHAYEAHQKAKGDRQYPKTLEEAGLSAEDAAGHTLEDGTDACRYLRNLARILLEDGDHPESTRQMRLVGVCEELESVLDDVVAPLACDPPELPPMVPTLEAMERWGRYWYRGEHVRRIAVGVGGRVLDHNAGDDVDPTDDWRGPVPRAPRGAR